MVIERSLSCLSHVSLVFLSCFSLSVSLSSIKKQEMGPQKGAAARSCTPESLNKLRKVSVWSNAELPDVPSSENLEVPDSALRDAKVSFNGR